MFNIAFTGWAVTDILVVVCVLIGLYMFTKGVVGLKRSGFFDQFGSGS